jgi:uncharacterized membrane protein YfcA
MTALDWIVALVVTALAALLQGVVGLGFAMVSVPILSLIDPRLAPVPQLLITMPLTISMAWRERQAMDLSGAAWIIAGRVPGAFLGLALLAVATGAALDAMIAVIVLLAVAIIASGYHVSRNPGTDFTAGVFSGTSSLVASVGGPPLALLYTDAEGGTIRSSLAAVFSVGILITVGVRAFSGNISSSDVRVAVVLFPALLMGYLFSGPVKDRVSNRQLKMAILVVSGLAAIGLLIRAVA